MLFARARSTLTLGCFAEIMFGVPEAMLIRSLLLTLTLVSVTGMNQAQDYRRPRKDLLWGADAKGLRISAWINLETSQVFAVIRNFSAKKICYCDYVLGNFVKVYARRDAVSDWQEIKPKPPTPEELKNMTYIGGLPCSENKILKPGKEMPPYAGWPRGKFKPPKREKKNYSFSLDLSVYAFPPDFNGAAQIKIVQNVFHGHCPDAYEGEVESPAFEIKLPLPK